MLCFVLILLTLIRELSAGCFSFYAPSRAPLKCLSFGNESTWEDWDRICSEKYGEYGILGRGMRRLNDGEESCENESVVPLGLMKNDSKFYWINLYDERLPLQELTPEELNLGDTSTTSPNQTLGGLNTVTGRWFLVEHGYVFPSAVCEKSTLRSLDSSIRDANMPASIFQCINCTAQLRSKRQAEDVVLTDTCILHTDFMAQGCRAIPSDPDLSYAGGWSEVNNNGVVLKRNMTSLELVARSCLTFLYNETSEDCFYASATFWTEVWTPCEDERIKYGIQLGLLDRPFESSSQPKTDISNGDDLSNHLQRLSVYSFYPLLAVQLDEIAGIVNDIMRMPTDRLWGSHQGSDEMIDEYLETILDNVITDKSGVARGSRSTVKFFVADLRQDHIVGIDLCWDDNLDIELLPVRVGENGSACKQFETSVRVSENLVDTSHRITFSFYQYGIQYSELQATDGQDDMYQYVYKVKLAQDVAKEPPSGASYVELIRDSSLISQSRFDVKECSRWVPEDDEWSTDGCVMIEPNNRAAKCRCTLDNNTGTFKIKSGRDLKAMFRAYRLHASGNYTAMNYIALVGSSLAIFGLIVIVFTGLFFKDWRERLTNKILLHIAASLLLNYTMLYIVAYNHQDFADHLSSARRTEGNAVDWSDPPYCIVSGVFMHYSLLVTFCWMLVMSGLQLLRLLTPLGAKKYSHVLLKVSIFAWGIPLIPVATLLGIDPHLYTSGLTTNFDFDQHLNATASIAAVEELYVPIVALLARDPRISSPLYFTRGFCYPTGKALIFGERVPILTILVINVAIFMTILMRVYAVCGWGNPKDLVRHDKDDKATALCRLRNCLFLFFLFGLSWVFGFVAMFQQTGLFAYLFCITVSLQGFVLFVYFVVFNELARERWCAGLKTFFC